MNNKNNLIVIKNSFFSKVKNFIFKLFRKKIIPETQVDYNNKQENTDKFRAELSKNIIEPKNKENIENLQKGLKSNNVKVQDLSNKQLNDMILLYKLQIKEKKEKLKKYRKVINHS